MNRIYQGRVSAVEIATGRNDFKSLAEDPHEARRLGEEMLWKHHELFQDAVNYYIVALAALGTSPEMVTLFVRFGYSLGSAGPLADGA